MTVEPMEVDEAVFATRPVPGWAQPIMSYMMDGSLPSDEVSARQVQRRSKAYTIINRELYKRSATTVVQRCVEPVVTMLAQEPWLLKHSDMGFTGLVLCSKQKISSGSVKDVKDLLIRFICRLLHSKLFPLHGRLLCGVWTWWGHSNRLEAT